MEEVLDVYHRPYDESRPLICIDEQLKQLVSETRVPLPPRPGVTARYDYEYKREGVANLFMLFEPLLGWRYAWPTERRTGKDFAEVLRWLAEELHPDAEKLVPVTDNLNTHPGLPVRGVRPGPGEAHRGAAGVALHAQARELAEHGGDRVRRPEQAVPGPADRLDVTAPPRGGRLG
jgi:hypothetical protein